MAQQFCKVRRTFRGRRRSGADFVAGGALVESQLHIAGQAQRFGKVSFRPRVRRSERGQAQIARSRADVVVGGALAS